MGDKLVSSEEYVSGSGSGETCPRKNCNGQVRALEHGDFIGLTLARECKCDGCGLRITEYYRFHDYEVSWWNEDKEEA